MTKKPFQTALFNVVEKPIIVDGLEVPSRKAIVRVDNGNVLSIVSNKYVPVDNAKVLETFTQIAEEAKVEWRPGDAYFVHGGVKTTMEIIFPQHVFEPKKGDIAEMRAWLTNGFSGSAAKLEMGFFRFICSNGAILGRKDMCIRYIHMGKVKERLAEEFKLYLGSRLGEAKHLAETLTHGNFDSQEQVRAIIEKTQVVGSKMKREVTAEWEKQQKSLSAWILYNVFTYVLSHVVKGNIERRMWQMKQLTNEATKWAAYRG